ncbi:MAG: type II toxin-antitoxin system VapC family toxin [Oscillospiraceae bacterium]|nr:type II toxin-antitoxin system VapC family toxin [Oscillospiraceae bacterium]
MIYALDTNTISYFIKGDTAVWKKMRAALSENHDFVIPPVTFYEIRRGFKHNPAPRKEQLFTDMCLDYSVGEMNITIWEIAADIYANSKKTGKTIEDTDILIAAFCIVNGYTLVSNNTKHFKNIDGLSLENWVE